jgi:hypothetical protein
VDGWDGCYFLGSAVPASIELEIGLLEPQILARYRAIGSANAALQSAQYQYLYNRAAQVHIFRQRIPIRNVDYTAYQ